MTNGNGGNGNGGKAAPQESPQDERDALRYQLTAQLRIAAESRISAHQKAADAMGAAIKSADEDFASVSEAAWAAYDSRLAQLLAPGEADPVT